MILKELLAILEAEDPLSGNKPLELRALAQYYAKRPDDLKKKLRQIWGTPRLVMNGQKFFDGSELGAAYDNADKAASAVLDDYEVEVNLDIPDDDFDRLDFETPIADKQEVYLGYSPQEDMLYIGYDCWIGEEDFNDEWDKQFKRAKGEDFDSDNEEHQALFDQVWKQYSQNHLMYGVLCGVDGNAHVEEVANEGFYKGIYRTSVFKAKKLIDLRLD